MIEGFWLYMGKYFAFWLVHKNLLENVFQGDFLIYDKKIKKIDLMSNQLPDPIPLDLNLVRD